MKNIKISTLILVLFAVLVSCKKEKNDDSSDQDQEQQEQVPSSFTQKALLEEFTGEWCVYCPDGAAVIEQIKTDHPDDFVAISYHISDSFEISEGVDYDDTFNFYGFPAGVVNRTGSAGGRTQWPTLVTQALNNTATCGIKLETSIDGNKLTVKVKYAGTEDFDAYLTVDIIEDEVPESSPGAQTGAPTGYKHFDVFRKVVTDQSGDQISVKNEKIETKTFSNIDIANYNKENLYVVAFIHKELNSNNRSVYNVQIVKAGQDKDFD